MLDSLRRTSKTLAACAAIAIGLASSTGLARTGAIAPVPGYAPRGKGPRGRDLLPDEVQMRLIKKAARKRRCRRYRNLLKAASGAYGPFWQVV